MHNPDQPQRPLDPSNGFPVIYRSERRGMVYSLLEIPAGAQTRVDYRKESLGIDISLAPLGPRTWMVNGVIDPDTFVNLGFPAQQERRGQTPPVVTMDDVARVERFGEIQPVGLNEEDQTLYRLAVRLEPTHIATFFRRVWIPTMNPAFREEARAQTRVRVEPFNDGIRVLPQKEPIPATDATKAKLFVVNSAHQVAS